MKQFFIHILTLLLVSNTYATVIWNGTNIFSVSDENIEITGDCYLQNDLTEINAYNCDVTVEVTKDSTIFAQQSNQFFYIYARWPYSVTIKVHHDLEFRGVENQPLESLQIYVYGDSTIRWEIDEDSSLTFNSTENSGNVMLWDSYTPDDSFPIHIFKATKKNQVTFGKRCSFGFSAEKGCGTGIVHTVIESDDFDGSDEPCVVMDDTSRFALEMIAVG